MLVGLVVPVQNIRFPFNRRHCHREGSVRKLPHSLGPGRTLQAPKIDVESRGCVWLTRKSGPFPISLLSCSPPHLCPLNDVAVSALSQEPAGLPGSAPLCPQPWHFPPPVIWSSLAISWATAGPEGLSWAGFCRTDSHPAHNSMCLPGFLNMQRLRDIKSFMRQ